jgi:hypothetical protein
MRLPMRRREDKVSAVPHLIKHIRNSVIIAWLYVTGARFRGVPSLAVESIDAVDTTTYAQTPIRGARPYLALTLAFCLFTHRCISFWFFPNFFQINPTIITQTAPPPPPPRYQAAYSARSSHANASPSSPSDTFTPRFLRNEQVIA